MYSISSLFSFSFHVIQGVLCHDLWFSRWSKYREEEEEEEDGQTTRRDVEWPSLSLSPPPSNRLSIDTMPGPAAKSSSDSKNEKGKKGKKRDPLELPFLASLRETYRVCCTGRGIRPHMPLLALIDDLSSQVAPLEKAVVVSPDPDFSPLSAEAVVDAISGTYGPKTKQA